LKCSPCLIANKLVKIFARFEAEVTKKTELPRRVCALQHNLICCDTSVACFEIRLILGFKTGNQLAINKKNEIIYLSTKQSKSQSFCWFRGFCSKNSSSSEKLMSLPACQTRSCWHFWFEARQLIPPTLYN
jgi:hypothetical protein